MAKSCHLICGEDDFQVEIEARKLVDRLVTPDRRDFGLEIVDGRVESVDACAAAIRQCLQSVATDGLFGGGEKLTWFREPAFLAQDRLGKSTVVKERLEDLVACIKAGLPEGRTLLLTTFRINRASALFKAFQAAGEVQDFGSNLRPRQREDAARQRLAEWLPRVGLQMTAEARSLFLARVGVDSRLLVNELEKLRCYCGEGATASAADVQAVVSLGREAEIWGILDAFGDRDASRLIAQLRAQLGQSESPIGVVTMLESRVSELLIVRQALDRGWAAPGSTGMALNWRDLPPAIEAWFAAADTDFRRMNPYRAGRLAAQAGNWTLRELRWARHLLIGLREALVSSSLPGDWLAETRLLQAIGTRRPARRRAAAAMGR